MEDNKEQNEYMLCPRHKKEYTHFCIDDDIVCCDDCCMENHVKCKNKQTLEATFRQARRNSFQDSFQFSVEGFNHILENANCLLESRLSERKKVQSEIEKATQSIKDAKMRIVRQIEALETLLLENVERQQEQMMKEIDEYINDINSIIDTANISVLQSKSVDSNFERKSPLKAFVLENITRNCLFSLESDMIAKFKNLITYDINFKARDIRNRSMISLGSFDVNHEESSNEFVPFSQRQAQIPILTEGTITSYSFDRHLNLKGENANITSVIEASNCAILADTKSNRLLVYIDNKFRYQIILAHRPWDMVSLTSTSMLILTSHFKDDLQYVDLKKQKLSKSVNVKDSNQSGISLIRDKLCIGSKGKILILDINGHVDRIINLESVAKDCKPFYIITDRADNFYFTDNKRFYCINDEGGLVFSKSLSEHDSFMKVGIDNYRNVYVLTPNIGLQRFKHDGTLIDILFKDRADQITFCIGPSCKHIYLAWKRGTNVSVYKRD